MRPTDKKTAKAIKDKNSGSDKVKKQKAAFEIEYEFIKDEDYFSCYIPDTDITFSVPVKSKSTASLSERIRKKAMGVIKQLVAAVDKQPGDVKNK